MWRGLGWIIFFLRCYLRLTDDSQKTFSGGGGKLTKGLNSTFIALIPKVDNHLRLNDFRPIYLVGSLYKILAKLLANWLRLVIVESVTFASPNDFCEG
jgi:hypothetical protein